MFKAMPFVGLALVLLEALLLGSCIAEEVCSTHQSASAAAVELSAAGRALLQTVQTEKEQTALGREQAEGSALRGRVEALETEVSSLQSRVSVLEGDVGTSGGGSGGSAAPAPPPPPVAAEPAPEEAAPALLSGRRPTAAGRTGRWRRTSSSASARATGRAISVPLSGSAEQESSESDDIDDEASDLFEASLIQSSDRRTEDDSIKVRVLNVESAMTELRSQVATLENHVMGSTFNTKDVALLQNNIAGVGSESSLKARIVALEDEGDSLRTRITSLEHVVTG